MKTRTLLTLVLTAVLAGCATAPFVVGSALQVGACALAQTRPESQAPLLAAGLVFQSYGDTTAPTVEELDYALQQVLDSADNQVRAEIQAFITIVLVQGYAPLYDSIKTEADKARLRQWFAAVGAAFVNGSHCRAAEMPAGSASIPRKTATTWIDLAQEVKESMKQVKK